MYEIRLERPMDHRSAFKQNYCYQLSQTKVIKVHITSKQKNPHKNRTAADPQTPTAHLTTKLPLTSSLPLTPLKPPSPLSIRPRYPYLTLQQRHKSPDQSVQSTRAVKPMRAPGRLFSPSAHVQGEAERKPDSLPTSS